MVIQLHGFLLLLLLLLLAAVAQAQQAVAPTTKTDPIEAAALNAVFAKLGQTADSSWNTSGDPCTGSATVGTDIDSNNNDVNPGIKCDCSDRNNTLCHITKLKIYDKDAAGQIPEELRNLTRLTHLNLSKNLLEGPMPSFIGELTDMQQITFGINNLSGPIPKELGNLANLISLSFGSNNFNGSLPPELGNLAKLEQLVGHAAENKSSSKTGVVVGVVVGATVIGLAALAAVFVWSQKRRKLSLEQQELYSIVGRPNVFSYGELRSATENFSSSNLLGEGGYGSVYKSSTYLSLLGGGDSEGKDSRREMRFRLRLSQLHGSLLLLLRLLLLAAVAQGQQQQAPTTTTDPTEAAALNAVFAKLGQTAHSSWNISGDPCTGSATDATDIDSNNNVNPGIKCDCSARNNTLCHITKL
ncbi:hypothetical protein ABZP36_003695 [Zizania latifolia]